MRVIARAQARAEAHPFPPRRGRPTSGVAHEADDNIRPHLRMLVVRTMTGLRTAAHEPVGRIHGGDLP